MSEPLQCQCCGKIGAEKRRQNTAYTDDSQNWVTLCPECHEDNDAYWADRWKEYYESRL